ncbi:MAG: hypothetical protein R3C03_10415 [Pirellulaceae bacterium]
MKQLVMAIIFCSLCSSTVQAELLTAFTTPGGSVVIDGVGTIEHFSDFAGLPRVLDYDFDPITGTSTCFGTKALALARSQRTPHRRVTSTPP